MLKKNKLAYNIFFISIFLLLLTRPRFELGFSLNPSYFILLFSPLALFFRQPKVQAHELVLLLFYVYCFFTAFYSPDIVNSFRFVFGALLLTTLLFTIRTFINHLEFQDFKVGFSKLGKLYLLTSFILYIIGALNFENLSEHDLFSGVYIERGFIRMTGMAFDPNMFGITLMPFLFFYLMSRDYKWFIFSCLLLVLSFSRGAWVAFLSGLVVFYFMQGIIKNIKATILFLLLSPFPFLLYKYNLFQFGTLIDSRLKNISDGSGRYEIWVNAFNLFLEKPIAGWGIFSFRHLNFSIWGNDRFAHNTYIEVLVETGIIGFLLYSLFFIFILFRLVSIYKKNKELGFLIPSFFSFLVGLMFLSLYINNLFLFFLILFGIELKSSNKENHA